MSTIKGRRETFIKTSLFFLFWWFKVALSTRKLKHDHIWFTVMVLDRWTVLHLFASALCPFLFADYMPIAAECWHLRTSWEHITVNVISTLKTALSPHTSLVGAFSRYLKGHTQPQPSTPDLSGRVKKEHLTASLMVKEGCKEWVKWRVKRVPAIWNVSTEI